MNDIRKDERQPETRAKNKQRVRIAIKCEL